MAEKPNLLNIREAITTKLKNGPNMQSASPFFVRFISEGDFVREAYDLIIVPSDKAGYATPQAVGRFIENAMKLRRDSRRKPKLVVDENPAQRPSNWLKETLEEIFSQRANTPLESQKTISVIDLRAYSHADRDVDYVALNDVLTSCATIGPISVGVDLLVPDHTQQDWYADTIASFSSFAETLGFDLSTEIQKSKNQQPHQDTGPASKLEEGTRPHFLADHATEEDLLGYYPYAAGIAAFVKDKRTRLPLTIAIDGAWGTGKSSLMKMLRNELDPNRPKDADARLRFRLIEELKNAALILLAPLRVLWFAVMSFFPRTADIPAEKDERRFVTVYVNAWRHGKGAQLKANIVAQVLEALEARFGPDFLLRLELRRFSRLAMFTAALRGILTNSVVLTLVALMSIIFVLTWWIDSPLPIVPGGLEHFARTVFSDDFNSFLKNERSITSLVAIGLNALLFFWKGRPSVKVGRFFEAPDYHALAGDEAQIERDFTRILQALEEMDCRLALFVDDLDRCAPDDCATVVEALNTFFGTEDNECLFILGMHREMVATALEVAYDKLVGQIEEKAALAEQKPFGRRFLEKVVQFVVTLPEPSEEATGDFLHALTAAERKGSLSEIKALEAARRRQGAAATLRDRITAWVRRHLPAADDLSMAEDPETVLNTLKERGVDIEAVTAEADKLSALKDRIEERKHANENAYVSVFNDVRPVLRANPRQYKRFFNELRFFRLLGAGRDTSLRDDAAEAALALEHPELYHRIAKCCGSLKALSERAEQPNASDEVKKLAAEAREKPGVATLLFGVAMDEDAAGEEAVDQAAQ